MQPPSPPETAKPWPTSFASSLPSSWARSVISSRASRLPESPALAASTASPSAATPSAIPRWSRGGYALLIPGGDQAFEIRRWSTFGRPLSVLTIVENTPDYGTYAEKEVVRVPASRVIDMSINPPTESAEYLKVLDPKHEPGE